MFVRIGKFAFYFLVVYVFLSEFVLIACLSCGLPPPEPLALVPQNWIQSIVDLYNQYANTSLPTTVYMFLAGIIIFNLIIAGVAGIPIIFHKIAMMTGILPLAIVGWTVGVFFQACAIMYAIARLTGRA